MISALIKSLFLKRFAPPPTSLANSFDGLMCWLAKTQDYSDDDGSSAGYSAAKGWLISYPETTGYIIWTLINHYNLFKEKQWLERASRMVKWEQQIQWPQGGIPGSYGSPHAQMVVFNTGMVLLGYSAYYRQTGDESVLESAVRAADWIKSCQNDNGVWLKGFSRAVSGGNLTFNAMVSWGLSELYLSSGLEQYKEMALRGARYYASFVGEDGWPDHSGLSDEQDRYRPLTHTLGYTLAGLYETAVLLKDDSLKAVALKMALGLENTVTKKGFIPGRIGPGFRSKFRWSCLTGSAQIAYVWLRMVQQGHGNMSMFYKALLVLEYIRKTQRIGTGNSGIDYAVAGSFPFSFRGYCRVTYPNWAAKFTIDCYHLLWQLSKNEPYTQILKKYGFESD